MFVLAPISLAYWPAAQLRQDVVPVAVWYWPAMQLVHVLVLAATAVENWPAMQLAQAETPVAIALYVPAAQLRHNEAML